ncbi:hypothetical protein ACFW15_03440, partial [Streptomyces sp. NPDC058953]
RTPPPAGRGGRRGGHRGGEHPRPRARPAPRGRRACDTLVAALAGAGYEHLSEEREFVLSDSDVSVDDGWLEEIR